MNKDGRLIVSFCLIALGGVCGNYFKTSYGSTNGSLYGLNFQFSSQGFFIVSFIYLQSKHEHRSVNFQNQQGSLIRLFTFLLLTPSKTTKVDRLIDYRIFRKHVI